MDPEVEFSKEALKCMGTVALKTKESLNKTTTILMELMDVALE
jgi:vesicle coat complex subunit